MRLVKRRRFLKHSAAMLAGVGGLCQVPARSLVAQPNVPDDLTALQQQLWPVCEESDEQFMRQSFEAEIASVRRLRDLELPPELEWPLSFRPYLSGQRPPVGETPRRSLRLTPGPQVEVPGTLEALAFWPVTALSDLIQRRQITSTQLTHMYLDRLKQYGPLLKCVVTLTEELALSQASRADREIQLGQYRGPLHGIPWGVKDVFATRGIPTTWGAQLFENRIFDFDATVVERLNEAGAVLVAKLSTPALTASTFGDWYGGSTRNPWNIDRGSRGSSAGSAAATAAGLVGFSIGTEANGSIVDPAAECGVTGLRSTFGRISNHGSLPNLSFSKVGPMCRSVEDCVLVFDAIRGSDGRDDSVVDAPFDWDGDAPISDLRIGYVQSEFEEASPNMDRGSRTQWRQVMAEALDVFRRAGASLEPMELPRFPALAVFHVIAAGERPSRALDIGEAEQRAQLPEGLRQTLCTPTLVSAADYLLAYRARASLMHQMAALMERYDVYLSPHLTWDLNVTKANLTGQPAVSIKAGFIDGIPMGLMITGRVYEEATVLSAALAYERMTNWHTTHPSLQTID